MITLPTAECGKTRSWLPSRADAIACRPLSNPSMMDSRLRSWRRQRRTSGPISRSSGAKVALPSKTGGGRSRQISREERPPMNNVIDFINVNRERYLDELKALLAIPSISALPEHAGDVRRCAEWCVDEMRRVGLENARLIETPGNPVAYADWLHAPGAPTILFYGHYDVQPVDPLNLWQSPPFEATIRDGEIYARGSADDKGQVFMHLKAIEAHLKQNGRLPVNMKLILEGEEEVGSVNLDNFVSANKAALA